ncbi:MAG: hypothetical protein U0694_26710 [Anaerolineae bacterium]
MTPAKRFLVRTSLITGSTMATILGAQSLAVLDLNTMQADTVEVQPADTTTVSSAAPGLIIIRHSADDTVKSASNLSNTVVTAPNPVVVRPPDPVIVQPRISRRTRSSR